MAKASYVRTAKTTFDNGIGRLSAGDCRVVRARTATRRFTCVGVLRPTEGAARGRGGNRGMGLVRRSLDGR